MGSTNFQPRQHDQSDPDDHNIAELENQVVSLPAISLVSSQTSGCEQGETEKQSSLLLRRLCSGLDNFGGSTTARFNTLQSSALLVNYISIGYILLPGGFATGGTVLTLISLLFISFQTYITGTFLLETCARAEALESLKILTAASPHGQRGLPESYSFQIRERTFEISELCRYFLGRRVRNIFTITIAGDLYGVTWTLAAVFGSSLSEGLPISANAVTDYKFYILIFMLITIPLSCVPITDQVVIQSVVRDDPTVQLYMEKVVEMIAQTRFSCRFSFWVHE